MRKILSMIRLENLHQIVRPVVLPSPDKESLCEFPVFRIPSAQFPVDKSDHIPIFHDDILRPEVAMRKADAMRLRKHSLKKTSDVAFWRALLVGVKKCFIEIVLGIKGAFEIYVSLDKMGFAFHIFYLPLSRDVDRL